MKLSRRVARFNKRVTNRIQGLYAWLVPPWAVILHRGRRSGRQYRTPLFAFRRGRTLVIALLYGEESEWLRNLRAGSGGHVIRRGAYLRRRSPRGRRYKRGRLAARTPVAPGARVLSARRETRDARPGGTAARLWAPRPAQRARVTRSSTARERQVWVRHACRCSYGHA